MTSKAEAKRISVETARERLTALCPKGSTVYTILRGEPSRSGMQRRISLVVIDDGELVLLDYWAACAMDRRESRNRIGIVCNGAGMDMGFDLVYSLGHCLYGDGYALKHRWT